MKSFTTFAVVASLAFGAQATYPIYNTTSIVYPTAPPTSTSTYSPPTLSTTYTSPPETTLSQPTYSPSTLTTYSIPPPIGTGTGGSSYPTGGAPPPAGNGTGSFPPTSTPGSSPTNVPVGPSSTSPGGPAFTGAASANTAFGSLAGLGLVVAYFL
jgi:hypothetical protein